MERKRGEEERGEEGRGRSRSERGRRGKGVEGTIGLSKKEKPCMSRIAFVAAMMSRNTMNAYTQTQGYKEVRNGIFR